MKERNEEQRRKNLQREIELLKVADKKTSVPLVEIFKEKDRTVLI